MESDINYPKSKAFNIFLRLTQFGLSLACTIFIAELVEKKCISAQFRIIEILSGVVLLVSLLALSTVKCSNTHPKLAFIILFIVDLAAVVAIGVFSFIAIANGENCAVSFFLYQYYLAAASLYTLIVLAILLLPLLWVQRFTNSPGNLIWPVFFLIFTVLWTNSYRWTLLGLALGTLAVSLLTFSVNLFAGCKGITTGVKSLISCSWILDLLLIIGSEAIVCVIYLNCQDDNLFSDYNGLQGKVFLSAFAMINLVDLCFWLYGYQSLDYENGDSIRDDLVKFGKNPQFDQQSDVQDYQPGKEGQYGQLR